MKVRKTSVCKNVGLISKLLKSTHCAQGPFLYFFLKENYDDATVTGACRLGVYL